MHFFSHLAYLDAGTGSLIVQSIIGIIAGVAVFWRRLVAALKQKFGTTFKKTSTAKNTEK